MDWYVSIILAMYFCGIFIIIWVDLYSENTRIRQMNSQMEIEHRYKINQMSREHGDLLFHYCKTQDALEEFYKRSDASRIVDNVGEYRFSTASEVSIERRKRQIHIVGKANDIHCIIDQPDRQFTRDHIEYLCDRAGEKIAHQARKYIRGFFEENASSILRGDWQPTPENIKELRREEIAHRTRLNQFYGKF